MEFVRVFVGKDQVDTRRGPDLLRVLFRFWLLTVPLVGFLWTLDRERDDPRDGFFIFGRPPRDLGARFFCGVFRFRRKSEGLRFSDV